MQPPLQPYTPNNAPHFSQHPITHFEFSPVHTLHYITLSHNKHSRHIKGSTERSRVQQWPAALCLSDRDRQFTLQPDGPSWCQLLTLNLFSLFFLPLPSPPLASSLCNRWVCLTSVRLFAQSRWKFTSMVSRVNTTAPAWPAWTSLPSKVQIHLYLNYLKAHLYRCGTET